MRATSAWACRFRYAHALVDICRPSATPPEMAVTLLSARVTENGGRFATGEPLVVTVDVRVGY